MRCAIYIRVSTKMQEDKYSLDAQNRELTNYAKQQNWQIIETFSDVESGGKLNKKGLNSVLDLADEQKIDVVLVIDQDRLSRLDTIEWEFLKSALRENNVKIAEPGNITDLSNADDEFISDLKNLLAKREKRTIVRRMMRGKKQRLIDGKGWGIAPHEYEYDSLSGKYKIKEEWAWIIPFIDNLYLNEQLGMASIAHKLNEISKTPTGKLWNAHLVHTRMTSKAFHGVMEKNFKGELVTVDEIYEPLRTLETFNQIQDELEKRRSQFKVTSRQRNDLHPFRRTAFTCGQCNRKISVAAHGSIGKPRYYLKHNRKLRLSDGFFCRLSINTIRVENNVLDVVSEILKGKEFAKKYINFDNDKESIKQLKQNIKKDNLKLNNLKSSLDKLLDLYLVSKINKNKYLEKEQEIQKQIDVFEKQLKEKHLKLNAIEKNEYNYDFIYQYYSVVNDITNELTPIERAKLIGKIFPQGIVYEDKLVLTSNISGIPVEVEIPIDSDPFPTHHTKKQ